MSADEFTAQEARDEAAVAQHDIRNVNVTRLAATLNRYADMLERPHRRTCRICGQVEGDPDGSPFCRRTMAATHSWTTS